LGTDVDDAISTVIKFPDITRASETVQVIARLLGQQLIASLCQSFGVHQCLKRDGLLTPDVNKNMTLFRGADKLGQKDFTRGQANSTGVPPDQKK
jgi:hypothetical protein